jgi:hypothetical protein
MSSKYCQFISLIPGVFITLKNMLECEQIGSDIALRGCYKYLVVLGRGAILTDSGSIRA